MGKTFAIFTVLVFLGCHVFGCSTINDRNDRQALRTLAGGAAGALVTWNAGGAIVGAFVMDIVNMTAIKYEDKQLENGEEAARRYNDKFKAEKKKEDDKEASQTKGADKKAEQKKEIDKEAEQSKDVDKKVERKKADDKEASQTKGAEKKAEQNKEIDKKVEQSKDVDKKVERKKADDKRVELIIENSSLAQTVRTGSMVEANVQYVLLSSSDSKDIKITETRILWSANKKMELAKREVLKAPGTYVSAIKFTVPDEISRGYCILFTTISTGRQTKTTKSVMNII